MIEILISKVFTTRNLVHLAHWKTKSFSEHTALGDLYEALVSDIDAVVETYQGAFGLVDISELPAAVSPANLIKHLEKEVVWIEDNCDKICQKVGAIENLLENLTGTYFKTIYKLKHLA